MNKIIILILCTFFLAINCYGYTSSQLVSYLNHNYNLYSTTLFDVDSVLNSEWLSKFKKVLEDIYSEDIRIPYLIIVNELDYSNLEPEEFFNDFIERFIPTNEEKKITFILLYCIKDNVLFNYAGKSTNIKSDDVRKYYNENKEKYDNYVEILYYTLSDIHDKLVKKAVLALIIVFSIVGVGIIVGVIIYCCYCKKKKQGRVQSNKNNVNNNQNQFVVPQNGKQVIVQQNPNMNLQNQPIYMQPNQNMVAYNVQTPMAYNQINNQQVPMNQNYNANPGVNNQQNIGYSSHNF